MADWPPAQVATRVAEIIRAHPESYDQSIWLETSRVTTGDMLAELDQTGECDTEACVAGWAVIVTAPASTEPAEKEYGLVHKVIRSGIPAEIKDLARQALGLSDLEALWLFDTERTNKEVLGALGEISAGHRVTVPVYDEEDEVAW